MGKIWVYSTYYGQFTRPLRNFSYFFSVSVAVDPVYLINLVTFFLTLEKAKLRT